MFIDICVDRGFLQKKKKSRSELRKNAFISLFETIFIYSGLRAHYISKELIGLCISSAITFYYILFIDFIDFINVNNSKEVKI